MREAYKSPYKSSQQEKEEETMNVEKTVKMKEEEINITDKMKVEETKKTNRMEEETKETDKMKEEDTKKTDKMAEETKRNDKMEEKGITEKDDEMDCLEQDARDGLLIVESWGDIQFVLVALDK